MSNFLQNQCILAIGETGLGKSFTATVFGAKIAKVGHSTEPETDKVTFYDIENGSFYVDTPGFSDSNDEKVDNEIVRLTLRVMQDKKISKITTILWFVAYANRATTFLKRQARVIEAFARDHTGNVWDNTIIVTKGDERGEGPKAAAKEISKIIYEQKHHRKLGANKDLLANTGYFEIRLFESLSERKQNVYKNLTSYQMNADNVFKTSEPKRIFSKYESLMTRHVNSSIHLEFRKVKCLNCSEETDPRLANSKCHLEKKLIHPEPWKQVHSERAEHFHPNQPTDIEILEDLSSIIGPANVYTLEKRWKCCRGKLYSVGCKSRYRCCKRPIGSAGCVKMYNCCNTILHDCSNSKECKDECNVEPGCRLVCSGCGQISVKNKGCSIEKKHNWSEILNSQQKQCIVAIGGTGLGKSYTATVFGANANVGHITQPETDKVTFYDIGNGNFFVDTPGLTDVDKESDNETMRSILREMQDRKIPNITTILWFVKYECRKTASLVRQAKFIETLARDCKNNVWDNVIIVTQDCRRGEGPRAAAQEIAKKVYEQKYGCKPDTKKNLLGNTGNFEITLFESLNEHWQKFYNRLTNEEMNNDNVFKKSEPQQILAKYEILMRGHTSYPISLEIRKVKCLNCSEETDPRFANPKCHLEKTKIHLEPLKAVHKAGIKRLHPGHLNNSWALFEDKKWTCCNKKYGSEGCARQYNCCGKFYAAPGCTYKYSCCNTIYHEYDSDCSDCKHDSCKAPGCTLVCWRCVQNPVKSEGCSIEGKHVWRKTTC